MQTTNISVMAQSLATLDPEARAVAAAVQDSHETRKQARAEREQAEQERFTLLQQAAERLRSIAQATLWQGVLKGAASLVSLAESTLNKPASADKPASAEHRGVGFWCWKGGNGALDAAAKIDPFGIHIEREKAEQQELGTGAELSSSRAQRESEAVSDAQRAQGTMADLLEKVLERRHAAMLASLKG